VVSPFACKDSTISPTSVSRRCLFFTTCGPKAPSRSRGTSMRTAPTASEMTVLARAPLRTFADWRPGPAWFFSCPRCPVISSFRAVSSAFLGNSFSSPSGPVNSRPRWRAPATIAAAAACSGDSCRPSSLRSLLCRFTASDVITHSAHPAGPQPGVVTRTMRWGGCLAGVQVMRGRPRGAIVRAWCPNRGKEDVL
jgi:hypothetical protein